MTHISVRLVCASGTRRGTILIIVAGLMALMAMLALAFLTRMRADAEEANLLINETRARTMLASAMQYIAETSRIGWDNPRTPNVKKEAFGWVDIRTGEIGPRDRFNRPLFNELIFFPTNIQDKMKWPSMGTHMICNAFLWTRPPTAISQRVAPNPVVQNPGLTWSQLIGYPNLDPTPLTTDQAKFLAGDKTPMPGADAPSWFRVYRKEPDVFIITCGGGTSGGYRNWGEVQISPDAGRWFSQADWEMSRNGEPILWYEVAWSPAVATNGIARLYRSQNGIKPGYISRPWMWRAPDAEGQNDTTDKRNQFGTFLYRQRLEKEPPNW